MRSRDDSESSRLQDALEAYRAAAHADADSHFDERALESQRLRILARLEQVGQRARVLPFPGAMSAVRTASGTSRRWISAAAAAGLLIGLVTGQLLHVMPGDNWGQRDPVRLAPPAARMTLVPVVASTSLDPEDALLDAIDAAVTRQGAPDLRAFDDITFASELRWPER
jgi:hypothetical protein